MAFGQSPLPGTRMRQSNSSPALHSVQAGGRCRGGSPARSDDQRPGSPFRSPSRSRAGARPTALDPSLWQDSPSQATRSVGVSRHRSGSVPNTSAAGSSSFEAFTRRSELWERQKARRAQELRKRREEEEEAACSFRPGAPQGSGASGSLSRGVARNRSAYKEAADRLSHPKPLVPRVSMDAVLWKEQRDEEVMRECTFQPDLSKSSKSFRSSCAKPAVSTMQHTGEEDGSVGGAPVPATPPRPHPEWTGRRGTVAAQQHAMAEATFAPQTLNVPARMVNAQAYLRDDVFSRLSFTGADPPGVADSCGPPSNSPSLQRSYSSGSIVNSSLQHFLERQEVHEAQRQRHMTYLERQTAPTLQPEIGDRSRRLAERRRHQEVTGVAPSVRCEPKSTEELQERKCTFRPKLTQLAKERSYRGLEMLAFGDGERRREKIAKQKQEFEKQEVQGLFAPKVKTYNGVGSRLRLVNESDSLLERMTDDRERELTRVRLKNQIREKNEQAEYTHAPKVLGDAPKFVRRMAESYRAAREAREKEHELQAQFDFAPEQRPTWR